MSLLQCASNGVIYRGLDYYQQKKVKSMKQIGPSQYEAEVEGSLDVPYHVHINIDRPKKDSFCSCPYAEGNRITCKHQIAVYFTVFTDEAEEMIRELEELQREEELREAELERYRLERYEMLKNYVYGLSEEEVRQKLLNYLIFEDEKFEDEYEYDEYYNW